MKNKKEILPRILRGMIYVLPATLCLSYYPIISLGMDGTMNYELSVPLLWLAIFDTLTMVMLIRRKKIGEIFRKWAWLIFPVFATLSLIWTANLLRGVLTVGIIWLIYVAIFGFILLKDDISNERFKIVFWKWFLGTFLAVCAWCWIQCVLDVMGVARNCSLLCLGCTYRSFGFPHPNGFAIEPQFMGNLLLAPTIVNFAILVGPDRLPHSGSRSSGPSPRADGAHSRAAALRKSPSLWQFCHPLKIAVVLFIFVSTLFLTMSRGAIYAFVVAVIFLTGFLIVRERRARNKTVAKRVVGAWGVIVLSFLFTLNMQGVFTWLSPTDDTYLDGVSRAVSQLSLGMIEIGDNRGGAEETSALETDGGYVENFVENFSEEAVFDGYVPESTDVRMKMTSVAMELWRSDVKTALFGVGIGGAGQALYDAGLIDSPKEIVQNEYASLLLEVGAVGITGFIVVLVGVMKWIWSRPGAGMLLTLMVAYLVSLCFFSGLPNALHIYLLPVILSVMYLNKKECKI